MTLWQMTDHTMFALYVCYKNLDFVQERLELQSNIALNSFEDNYMKMNSGKCHLFVSGNKYEHI